MPRALQTKRPSHLRSNQNLWSVVYPRTLIYVSLIIPQSNTGGGSMGPQQPRMEQKSSGIIATFFGGGYGQVDVREKKRQDATFERAVNQQVERHVAAWKQAIGERDAIIDSQISMIRALEDEKNKLLENNANLQEHLESQEVIVAEAQSKALQMLDQAEWTPQEDSKIKQELTTLEKAIRTWSKNSTIDSLLSWKLQLLPEEDMEALRYDWEAFTLLPAKGLPIPQGFEGGSMDNKAWMIMAAWLTSQIYTQVFRDPFFFMQVLGEEFDLVQHPERKPRQNRLDKEMNVLLAQLEESESLATNDKFYQHKLRRNSTWRSIERCPPLALTATSAS
jgi:hypothetical protein